MATYPQNIALDAIAAQRFMQKPEFVARRLQTLADLRFVGTMLLKGRQDTVGGAVGYTVNDVLFADDQPEIVAPGAEYTLTTINDGPAGTARVAKWGKDTIVTDESIKRRAMDPVNQSLTQLANSAALVVDKACTSVIASAVTANRKVDTPWTADTKGGTAPNILRDILRGRSAIRSLNKGYDADVLLIEDEVWAFLASDDKLVAAMAREDKSNPVYTGRFDVLAGLEVIPVPKDNLPGKSSAWLLDTNQLGFIAKEDLGGGYNSAGDLVETKVMRDDLTDSNRIRARANFAPVVDNPGAGFRLDGVDA